ncbi:MAG: two-component regulator propeller domain-containing protein [Chloroflexota bacterium]
MQDSSFQELFPILACCLGSGALLFLLIGAIMERRYHRSNPQSPKEEEESQLSFSERYLGDPRGEKGVFLLWLALALAIVDLLWNLPQFLSWSILPIAILAAAYHWFVCRDGPLHAQDWLGLGLAFVFFLVSVALPVLLDPTLGLLPSINFSNSFLTPRAEWPFLVICLCYALLTACRSRPSPLLRLVLVGLVAGVLLHILLKVPLSVWVLAASLPGAIPAPFGSLPLALLGASACLVLLGLGPLAVAWVRPAGKRDRALVGAGSGAVAGSLFFAWQGSILVNIISASPFFRLGLSPAENSQAQWIYALSSIASASLPAIILGLWACVLIGALVSALTGLLTPVEAGPPQPTSWPLEILLVSAPGLLLVAMLNIAVLALFDPAIQNILDAFGVEPPLGIQQNLLLGMIQPGLLLLALQLLVLGWLRNSALGGRAARFAGMQAMLFGLIAILMVILLQPSSATYLTWVQFLQGILGLEMLASGWRLTIYQGQPAADLPPMRFDGAGAGLFSALLVASIGLQTLAFAQGLALLVIPPLEKIAALQPADIPQLSASIQELFLLLFTSTNLVFGMCLACMVLLSSILGRWRQRGWFLETWQDLCLGLARLGQQPGVTGLRLLAVLSGLLLGILAASHIPPPWLFTLGTLLALLVTPRRAPLRQPLLVLAPAFLLAAAGFTCAWWETTPMAPSFLQALPLWSRSILYLLAGPAAGIAFRVLAQATRRRSQLAWRLVTLLGVALLAGALTFTNYPLASLRGGLSYYDGAAWQRFDPSNIPLGRQVNFHFFQDSRSRLWAVHAPGLALLQTGASWQAYAMPYETQSLRALKMVSSPCMLEDSSGQLWLARLDQLGRLVVSNTGVDFLDFAGSQAKSGERSSLIASSSPLIFTDCVSDPAGDIWLATNGAGVFRLPSNQPEGQPSWETFSTENSSLPSDGIHALLIDQQGRLLLGTRAGLSFFDEQDFTPIEGNGLQAAVLALFEGTDGELWVGTEDGGSYWDGAQWRSFASLPGWPGAAQVKAILEDRYGNIWVGSASGVLRYDRTQWQIVIPGLETTLLRIDPAGQIWAGGAQGLVRYAPSSGILQRFTAQAGDLAASTVQDLAFDSQGLIWVSTFDVSPAGITPHRAATAVFLFFALLFLRTWWGLRSHPVKP